MSKSRSSGMISNMNRNRGIDISRSRSRRWSRELFAGDDGSG